MSLAQPHATNPQTRVSMLQGIGWFAIGVLLTLLVLEGVLRLLPVNAGWTNPAPTHDEPLIRYVPGAPFVYSRGWSFANVQRGRFNNLGYVSEHDYRAGALTVAVIGDSYVEAAMIPGGRRMHERLQILLPGWMQAIGMGQSGADLADDLVMARYAATHFELKAIVILLSPADVLSSGKPRPRGFWFSGSGSATRIHSAAQVALRNQLYRSRLLSYLFVNLKFAPADLLDDGFNAAETEVTPASDFDATASDHLAFFLHALQALAAQEGLRPEAVVLLLDADRTALYEGGPASALHNALLQRARDSGASVIDLSAAFGDEFARTGRKLEMGDDDSHWNARAHQIAAQRVAEALRR